MPTPDDSRELQFERAEKGEEAPKQVVCATCGREIPATYFERGGQVVCPDCRDRMLAERERGTRASRFGRAALFGTGAAIVGALLWFGVSKLTGYEFSLIAIVIGFLVGAAVKKGSFGRGGWAYQGLAMFLTYTAIVSTYIPAIFEAMNQESPIESAAASGEEAAVGTESPTPDELQHVGADQESTIPQPVGLVLGIVLLFGIAFAAPFLAGFENFLGWIILAIGLYEAWKLNRKETLIFEGPFRIGGAGGASTFSPAATEPPPPPPPPIAP